MTLGSTLSDLWRRFQGDLFPALAEAVGPLLETHKRFVTALDLVKVEGFVDEVWTGPGRPREDRQALARGFIAKAVWGLPTTRHLIDRLKVDPTLRRLCGWSRVAEIPREATFSRTFAECSQSRLPERMHAALVAETLGDALIGHVSRDPTAIEARETPAPTPKARTPNRKGGRPRKGAERTKGLGVSNGKRTGWISMRGSTRCRRSAITGQRRLPRGSWRPGAVTSCISTQQTAGCR